MPSSNITISLLAPNPGKTEEEKVNGAFYVTEPLQLRTFMRWWLASVFWHKLYSSNLMRGPRVGEGGHKTEVGGEGEAGSRGTGAGKR